MSDYQRKWLFLWKYLHAKAISVRKVEIFYDLKLPQ